MYDINLYSEKSYQEFLLEMLNEMFLSRKLISLEIIHSFIKRNHPFRTVFPK